MVERTQSSIPYDNECYLPPEHTPPERRIYHYYRALCHYSSPVIEFNMSL